MHLFCSKHNPGVLTLVQELTDSMDIDLEITFDRKLICECAQMLLYLTAQTWQVGARRKALAAHVSNAMDNEVPLLLVHEMPGVQQEGRHSIEFDKFFVCDKGATPQDLLKLSLIHI